MQKKKIIALIILIVVLAIMIVCCTALENSTIKGDENPTIPPAETVPAESSEPTDAVETNNTEPTTAGKEEETVPEETADVQAGNKNQEEGDKDETSTDGGSNSATPSETKPSATGVPGDAEFGSGGKED